MQPVERGTNMFVDNKVRRFFLRSRQHKEQCERGSFSHVFFFFGENFTIAIHLENELCFVTLLFLFGNYNSLESSGVY